MRTIQDIMLDFEQTNEIVYEDLLLMASDSKTKIDLLHHIKKLPNRSFAQKLLSKAIEHRKKFRWTEFESQIGWIDNLIFCSYILGLHKAVEDCLLIMDVKSIDFDTECGFDTELTLFAGIDETIKFLQNTYGADFSAHGYKRFENLEEYFSEDRWLEYLRD